jgi:CheY-like chemotaxis protein
MGNEPLLEGVMTGSEGGGWTSETSEAAGAGVPRVDLAEFSRATMNLSLNARGAMPESGTVMIGSANVDLRATDAMDQVLTTILGIVERSSGAVSCESEPDRRTVFSIFLPLVPTAAPIAAPSPAGVLDKATSGSEVILLVEDEDMVRGLARTILETSGYVVLEACDGREGLTICETNEGPIDLLLSDVVMPQLSGRELAEHAVKLRPAMKIMFMSGYAPEGILKDGVQKGTTFLQKPFTPVELAQKVRQTLDADAKLSSSAPAAVRNASEPGVESI